MFTSCGAARDVVLRFKGQGLKEAHKLCFLPSQSSRNDKGSQHISFSLDSFRDHPERKGPHRAGGWNAAEFNESKEGNKMSRRGVHRERITMGSQESVPHDQGTVSTG